ncbi:MAG: hypothetical protein L6W00_09135 [Lentisphaeria bacterium]|nr:MAG: hypothetical protein L6W00_09135 [Lentisphaeria bacterium]
MITEKISIEMRPAKFAAGGKAVFGTGRYRPEHLAGTVGAAEDVAHRRGIGEGLIHPEYENGAEHENHDRQPETRMGNFHQQSSPEFVSWDIRTIHTIRPFCQIFKIFYRFRQNSPEKKQSGLPNPVLQCIFYEMEYSAMAQLQQTGLLYR